MAVIFSNLSKVKYVKIYSKVSKPVVVPSSDTLLIPKWLTNNFDSLTESNNIAFQLSAMNTKTYSLISGQLPTGVTLNSTGLISGTIIDFGVYNFKIRAKNGLLFADKNFTIIIKKLIQVSLKS